MAFVIFYLFKKIDIVIMSSMAKERTTAIIAAVKLLS
jgi:hypothetical protein